MYRWVPTITVSTRDLKNSGYGAVWKRTRAQTVREPLKCKCASTYIIYLCVMCVPIMMINNNNNNIIQLVGSSLYCEWVPTRRHLWNMIRLQLLSLSYYYIVRGRRFYILCVLHCVILCYALYWMKRSFKKTFCFFFLSSTFPICMYIMCHSRFDVFSFRVYNLPIYTRTTTEG